MLPVQSSYKQLQTVLALTPETTVACQAVAHPTIALHAVSTTCWQGCRRRGWYGRQRERSPAAHVAANGGTSRNLCRTFSQCFLLAATLPTTKGTSPHASLVWGRSLFQTTGGNGRIEYCNVRPRAVNRAAAALGAQGRSSVAFYVEWGPHLLQTL